MQEILPDTDNWRNYEKLMVAIEASHGILNLLIAVCDDQTLREKIIQRYEAELAQEQIRSYRVRVPWQDPSLRRAIAHLVDQEPVLQQGEHAVVTILGIDDLIGVRLGTDTSEQERFFGYLQWTREALRQFCFPIVLWLSSSVLTRLAERAPDFWSWRGGVFWFEGTFHPPIPELAEGSPITDDPVPELANGLPITQSTKPKPETLPPEEILRLIHEIEQQGQDSPLLSTLYSSLGQAYTSRGNSVKERQSAIQAFKQAIQLQKKLGFRVGAMRKRWL